MSLFNQRKNLEAELVERAMKDDDFRRRLTADPKAALESEWGVSLPDDLQIQVHQEKRNQLHVVLPSAAGASDQLSSEEMGQPVSDSSWSSWGHFSECVLECTQCGNNDTSCAPGPTEG